MSEHHDQDRFPPEGPLTPCVICNKTFERRNYLHDQLCICSDCARKIGQSYWQSCSGESHPDFCTSQERRDLKARKDLLRSLDKKKIPPELRDAVFQRDGFVCRHCGSVKNLRADHIHPESKGGPTTFENLQTLCNRCNSKKGVKVPEVAS